MKKKMESIIAGVDEAGRGPLAGPVVAAAVILNPQDPIDGLMDSKLLTEKQREALFVLIHEKALAINVGVSEVSEIDDINILQATLLAMKRAVEGLPISPDLVLIDGNAAPRLDCEVKTIIKGDQLEPAISAASIVAKVIRDREMKKLDKDYPEYKFAKHKGYSTREHLEALQKFGPSKIHRVSYEPVARLMQKTELQE